MKKILATLVILVAAGAAFWFVKRSGGAEEGGDAAEAVHPRVETVALQRQALSRTVTAYGIVVPAPSAAHTVAATYECIIRRVAVAPGATVAAGDLLLELAPSPETKLAFDSAAGAARLAESNLAAVRQRAALKLATGSDLAAAAEAAREARDRFANLRARGLGGDGRIVAAATGVVGPFDLVPGALVAPGTALVTVSSAGGLEVRLGVEAADAGAVAAGQPVQLISTNRPDVGALHGQVRAVAGAIDPVSGHTEVRVALPPGSPLVSGEHVHAAIEVETKADALVVPRNALLPDGDKWELFTIVSGKAVHHEVERGIVADDLVEVIAPDLHPGDAVVTLGNYELEDGMVIQPPAPPAQPENAQAAAKPAAEAKP